MTAGEFVKAIEDYWGEYPRPGVKAVCAGWAAAHEWALDQIYQGLIETVDIDFNRIPVVAHFEKIAAEKKTGWDKPPKKRAADDLVWKGGKWFLSDGTPHKPDQLEDKSA